MVLAQKQKYRPVKKIENPKINPRTHGHLIIEKGGNNAQWRKDSLFNKWCWDNWTAMCERMKLEHFLTTYTKINSKWKLKHKSETIKLLEEKIGRICFDINHKILYDPPPRVMEIKTKINKGDLIQLKRCFTTKETISKMKRQPSEWVKIISIKAADKGYMFKIYKQLNIRKTSNPIKKIGRRPK